MLLFLLDKFVGVLVAFPLIMLFLLWCDKKDLQRDGYGSVCNRLLMHMRSTYVLPSSL